MIGSVKVSRLGECISTAISVAVVVVGASNGCAPRSSGWVEVIAGGLAHVSVTGPALAVGDRVSILERRCRARPRHRPVKLHKSCETIRVGEGEVVGFLDATSVAIRVDPNISVEAGSWVEKADDRSGPGEALGNRKESDPCMSAR